MLTMKCSFFYHLRIAKFSAPENNQAMSPKSSNHQQIFMDRNDIRVCCFPYSDLIKSIVQMLKSKDCFCRSRILTIVTVKTETNPQRLLLICFYKHV